MRTVLILLADETDACAVEEALPAGWTSRRAASGDEGVRLLAEARADLVVTDLKGTRVSGEGLLIRLRTLAPGAPILVALPESRRPEAVICLERGATDLVALPAVAAEVRARLLGVLARFPGKAPAEVSPLEQLLLAGVAPVMAKVREQIAVVSRTDLPVLLVGESGTGKEVVARQIHGQGRRRDEAFVVVNCAAIAESLFETELFGHVRGAFTGATASRTGILEEADGGTLFLDEVGELAPPFQAKLLRVMQEGEYLRVGDTKIRTLDVRFVYATQKDLAEEVAAKRVREDFYYRLQVFPIHLPALRERPEDIPLLAAHFLQHYCRELGKPFEGIEPGAAEALTAYVWPGNIRELQNRMRFAALYLRGSALGRADLPADLGLAEAPRGSFARAKLDFERGFLTALLRRHRGNVNRAARESGKQRAELYRMIRRCGLTPEQFREES